MSNLQQRIHKIRRFSMQKMCVKSHNHRSNGVNFGFDFIDFSFLYKVQITIATYLREIKFYKAKFQLSDETKKKISYCEKNHDGRVLQNILKLLSNFINYKETEFELEPKFDQLFSILLCQFRKY